MDGSNSEEGFLQNAYTRFVVFKPWIDPRPDSLNSDAPNCGSEGTFYVVNECINCE